MKTKYSKCQCCPYYVKVKDISTGKKSWKCSVSECVLSCSCDTLTYRGKINLITRWINANNGIDVTEYEKKE